MLSAAGVFSVCGSDAAFYVAAGVPAAVFGAGFFFFLMFVLVTSRFFSFVGLM